MIIFLLRRTRLPIINTVALLIWMTLSPLTQAETPGVIDKAKLFPFHACVWDPIGKSGPAEKILKEVKIKLMTWGIDLTYVIYSEELIAIEEFKLGRCDAVNMLDFRVRPFNHFMGRINA